MSLGSDLCTADELLGSYALVSQLASGHLTSLHRAHAAGVSETSASSRATLVIKRLLYSHVHEQADRELLLAAGRAGMRVRSPNVLRVLAVHEDPEPFLVLEHVQGVVLSTLLAETLDQEVLRYVFPILVDVLAGLEVLHGYRDPTGTAASLVHGAPSARHVLIGEDGVARLIDLTHATGPGFSVAARRSLRLLPGEMAPEQVLAPMHVDARCDLFIVGSVLWRALTGQPLFAHEQREEALQQLLRKPILAPSEAGSLLGKRFDRICLRALARARAERYASAAEMARELKAEAERAGLYASRDEIASLVRTLLLANQDTDEESEIVLTAAADDVLARGSARLDAPAAHENLAARDAKASVRGEPSGSRAALHAATELPLDILTIHHQGSSCFGFEAGAQPRLGQGTGPTPTVMPATSTLTEAVPSVSAFCSRDEHEEAAPPLGSRESGTWYEGLPSIFPQRAEPRSQAPFWLWGSAAALALLGSVVIDNPPWQSPQRLHDPQWSERASVVRSDMAGAPASALGYAAFFASPERSSKSSALPPRGADAVSSESAEAPLCAPSAELTAAKTPPVAPVAEHTVSAVAPEAPTPRPKLGKRFLSPLPPNPY
jgi:Protein kinase domain